MIASFDDGEPTKELPKVPPLWAPPPQIRVRRDLRLIAIVPGAVAMLGLAMAVMG